MTKLLCNDTYKILIVFVLVTIPLKTAYAIVSKPPSFFSCQNDKISSIEKFKVSEIESYSISYSWRESNSDNSCEENMLIAFYKNGTYYPYDPDWKETLTSGGIVYLNNKVEEEGNSRTYFTAGGLEIGYTKMSFWSYGVIDEYVTYQCYNFGYGNICFPEYHPIYGWIKDDTLPTLPLFMGIFKAGSAYRISTNPLDILIFGVGSLYAGLTGDMPSEKQKNGLIIGFGINGDIGVDILFKSLGISLSTIMPIINAKKYKESPKVLLEWKW